MSKTGTLAQQIDPAILAIPAAPTGLAWCPEQKTLVRADSARSAIVRGDHTLAVLPSESGLGAIALGRDGAVYVTVDGEPGRVFAIDDAHGMRELPALGAAWRLGIACDRAANLLYVTQFQMSRFGAHDGAIVSIDLATGAASLVLDGFHKPVGIVQLGGKTLVVADARARALYRIELVAGRAVSRLQLAALPDRPEHLCACGDGAVLVTSYDPVAHVGTVRRIELDGDIAILATGAWEPRGIAFDGRNIILSAASGVLVMPL